MSLLASLTTDASIENETDSVGNSYGPIDSGLYASTVDLAYLSKSSGGALSVVLHLKAGNSEVRETLWVSSGDAKGNRNFYVTKDGEKKYLPGFNTANSLCLLTVGKELAAVETEEKVVNLWSSEAKAQVPTKVQVLTELMGQEIIAGVIKQIVDKNVKNDAGEYVPSGETREENTIDKFFRARDKMTTAEIRAGAEEPAFYNTWNDRFTGTVRDRSTKDAGSNTSGAFQTAANSGNAKPTQSLFGS